MKSHLAPTLTHTIGNSYILWFALANSYIIIDETLHKMLLLFLKTNDKHQFINELINNFDSKYDNNAASLIYNDISLFLEEQNNPIAIDEDATISFNSTKHTLKETYQIDAHAIEINFSSEKIKQYIHPQLMHLCKEVKTEHKIIFDIYKAANNLLLFKNEQFIGSYSLENYHLLQGRFVMELLCVLHKKKEHDWLGTFHASTVSNGKEAIMLVGDSGNGKSTFCALLMAAGLDLMADDITPILSADQEVYRYPSAISIKQGAFEILHGYYPNFAEFDSFDSHTKKGMLKYIPPKQHFNKSIQHVPCTKIVYVKYNSLERTTLKETSADKVLQTLIPDSWVSPEQENAKQFLNWLENLDYFELRYSDNEKAMTLFNKLFTPN